MKAPRVPVRCFRVASLVVLATIGLSAPRAAAQVVRTNYAQMLVNQLMLKHSGLLVVTMRATAPGASESTVIASNLNHAGEKSDAENLEVIRTDRPVVETSKEEGRCKVLLPLRAVDDRTIGSLGIVFKVSEGQPESGFLENATAMRNQLRAVIPDLTTLFEPFIVGSVTEDTLAQKLTMQALARHPDILVVAMHVTPPGGKANKVIAINVPKFIGRDSDEVDTDTEKTGKIVMQVIPKTHRLEVHMPMLAADGSRVGTVCTVYLWEDESQAADLFARSLAMRDELRPQIPGYEALFKP
jgi:hypothetical protein